MNPLSRDFMNKLRLDLTERYFTLCMPLGTVLMLLKTSSLQSTLDKNRIYKSYKLLYFYSHKLTHYHTMSLFDALKIYGFGKHCEKRRNGLEQAVSPFLTMFSTL